MARRLNAAGIACIPIRTDGSKRTTLTEWKPFQKCLPTPSQIESWFSEEVGIAVIGGIVSGNLEILDIDEPGVYEQLLAAADDQGEEYGILLRRLPRVVTPSGGTHLYYRCAELPEGNQKLAETADRHTIIETRGEGGYAITAPSPAACHPDAKSYSLAHGDIADPPTLEAWERAFLHHLANGIFNKYTPPRYVDAPSQKPIHPQEAGQGFRPGDDYNQRGDFESLLEKHSWNRLRRTGEGLQWRRPGKQNGDCSATTGYQGMRGLYVFSSNAVPFEPQTPYSPFAVYALLEHDGDYNTAAAALAAQGYGEPDPRFEQIRLERSEQRERDALQLACLKAENPEILSGYVDKQIDSGNEKRKNFLFSPETEEKPAGDTLYHVGASFNDQMEKAGIRVDGLRLHISPNLDYEVIEKVFNAFIDFEGSATTVINFWMGQMYNALPRGQARRRIVGARFDGQHGIITDKMIDKYQECAKVINRIPVELWDAGRRWTMYEQVSHLAEERIAYWLERKLYKGIMLDIAAEVSAGKPSKEGESEKRDSISFDSNISSLYVPSTLAEQITDRAQAQHIDIPAYLHSLIITPPLPESSPIQQLVALSAATVATLEARAQARGISVDAYIASLVEQDASAPDLAALCIEDRSPAPQSEPPALLSRPAAPAETSMRGLVSVGEIIENDPELSRLAIGGMQAKVVVRLLSDEEQPQSAPVPAPADPAGLLPYSELLSWSDRRCLRYPDLPMSDPGRRVRSAANNYRRYADNPARESLLGQMIDILDAVQQQREQARQERLSIVSQSHLRVGTVMPLQLVAIQK